MPITFTRIVPVVGLLAFSLMAGTSSFAQEQEQPRPGQPAAQQPPARPAPAPAPAPQPSAAQQKPQTQTARGELASVDATAKMLTIKPTEGAEQKFQYNDATKVTGDRAGVAGLATLSGKEVVVHFTSQGAERIATEIEVQAEKK
jgi:hypothetical protein